MARRWLPLVVGAALVVGLSPALAIAFGQLVAEPRLYYVIAPISMLIVLARNSPRDSRASLASALPWVLAAVVIQLLAEAGGFARFSRFAIPFGMVAFLRGVCGTPLPVSLLSFLCVPPPHVLTGVLGMDHAVFWSDLAARVSPRYAGPLVAWDGGLRLLAVATATVSYRCLRASLSLRRAISPLAVACGLAIPLQILSLVLAGFAPSAISHVVFIHGSWILVTLLLLFLPLPGFGPQGKDPATSTNAV